MGSVTKSVGVREEEEERPDKFQTVELVSQVWESTVTTLVGAKEVDQVYWQEKEERKTRIEEAGIGTQEPGPKDLEPGAWNQESRIRTRNQGPGTRDRPQ